MKVSVGLTLQEREPPYRIWEIVRIVSPPHGFRHARLRRVDDHSATMILSCEALRTEDFYLSAEPETAG